MDEEEDMGQILGSASGIRIRGIETRIVRDNGERVKGKGKGRITGRNRSKGREEGTGDKSI